MVTMAQSTRAYPLSFPLSGTAAFPLLFLFFPGRLEQLIEPLKIDRVGFAEVLANFAQCGGGRYLDDLSGDSSPFTAATNLSRFSSAFAVSVNSMATDTHIQVIRRTIS